MAYFFGRDQAEVILQGDRDLALPSGQALFWTLAALGIVLVLIAGSFFLSWWFTRYQVGTDHVRVHSGVLMRRQRQARLDRVQAIDIVQPLLARLFGLAELRFEVADAGESAVRLAYLRLSDAQELRATILDRASGAAEDTAAPPEPGAAADGEDPGGTPPAPARTAREAPEQQILALRPGRVIAATLLSGTTVFLVLAVAAVITFTLVFREPVGAAVLVPLLFGAGSGYWSVLSNAFNFRAAVSRDGIRLHYGLLDTRAQTVPPGRIQAVAVNQPPLWRLAGWYSVSVNVAGYGTGTGTEGQARTKLLPVGTLEEVFSILALALPAPGTTDPRGVFAAGMNGSGDAYGFTPSPRRARWLSPFTWRRNAYALTETALLVRSGFLFRALAVVPHGRTQSLALEQGPLNRSLHLADLVLHSTPGPVSPRIHQLDERTASILFTEQASRARSARHRDIPEQWLRRPAATAVSDPPPPPPPPQALGKPPAAAPPPAAPPSAAPPSAPQSTVKEQQQ